MVWHPDTHSGIRKKPQMKAAQSTRKKRAVTVPVVNDSPSAPNTGSGSSPTQNGQSTASANGTKTNTNPTATWGVTSDDIALWAAVVTIIGDSLALLALLKAREENPDS